MRVTHVFVLFGPFSGLSGGLASIVVRVLNPFLVINVCCVLPRLCGARSWRKRAKSSRIIPLCESPTPQFQLWCAFSAQSASHRPDLVPFTELDHQEVASSSSVWRMGLDRLWGLLASVVPVQGSGLVAEFESFVFDVTH